MTIYQNLAATVIADGDGKQCGASYNQRIKAFQRVRSKDGALNYARDWVQAASLWLIRHDPDADRATLMDIQSAAKEVAEYYQQHVKELSV